MPNDIFKAVSIKTSLYASGLLSLDDLKTKDGNQNYLPLQCIKLARHHNISLLPFVNLNEPDLFSVWFLDDNYTYIDQKAADLLDITTLYRLAVTYPSPPSWLTNRTAIDQGVYLTALKRIKRQICESETIAKQRGYEVGLPVRAPESTIFFDTLLYHLIPADLEDRLINQLLGNPTSLPSCSTEQLLSVWQYACRKAVFQEGVSTASDRIILEHRYALLKELYLFCNGIDIVYNPFTGLHQEAYLSTFIPCTPAAPPALSINKALLLKHGNVDICEFRGAGYSMMGYGYQIGQSRVAGSTYCITGWPPKNMGAFSLHAAKYIEQSRSRPSPVDQVVNLINLSISTNFGHTLWNDMSGYYLVNAIVKRFPDLKKKVQVNYYFSTGAHFSDQSYGNFFLPFIEHDLDCLSLSTFSDMELVASLGQPMILKSMVASRSLIERIREHYPVINDDTRIPSDDGNLTNSMLNILVNLRSHNKSFLNIAECLDCALSTPLMESYRHRLIFTLEMHHSAVDMAVHVEEVLNSHAIQHSRLVDCTLDQLCQVIAHSKGAIAPVGSALVMPTWCYNLDCLVHADPLHMAQLDMWPLVAPYFPDIKRNMHAIPLEGIHPDTNKLYSNYNIDPHVFSDYFYLFIMGCDLRSKN